MVTVLIPHREASPAATETNRSTTGTSIPPDVANPPFENLKRRMTDTLASSGNVALAALRNGRIVYSSSGLLDLFGVPDLTSADRSNWLEYLHAEDRARIAAQVHEASRFGREFVSECRLADPPNGPTIRMMGFPAAVPALYTLLFLGGPRAGKGIRGTLPEPERPGVLGPQASTRERLAACLHAGWQASHPVAILAVGLHPKSSSPDGWTAREVEDTVINHLRPYLRRTDAIGYLEGTGIVIGAGNVLSITDAAAVAGRLVGQIVEPQLLGGRYLSLEANIGIALYPHDETNLDGLLDHARFALQVARQAGHDRYSFAEGALNAALQPQPMNWDAEVMLGNAKLDSQHCQLIWTLNRLQDGADTADLRELHRIEQEMVRSINADTVAEDGIIDSRHPVGSESHRAEHRKLYRSLAYLKHAEARQGYALEAKFLQEWLRQHIAEFDAPLLLA